MPVLRTDFENPAEEFWSGVRLAADAPEALRAMASGVDEVHVGTAEFEAARQWCEGQPLWRDKDYPDYAPHPILFVETDYCAHCGKVVSSSDQEIPPRDDDAAWAVLAQRHFPDCEWIATRGRPGSGPAAPRPQDRPRCRFCGKPLPKATLKTHVPMDMDPQRLVGAEIRGEPVLQVTRHGEPSGRNRQTVHYWTGRWGRHGDNLFCGLNCGYRWARRELLRAAAVAAQ